MSRMSFEEAKRRYVHRFTMEHVPTWAAKQADNLKFYAPQYATDREWYDNTTFPGDTNHPKWCRRGQAYTSNESWPLGMWLDAPYRRA